MGQTFRVTAQQETKIPDPQGRLIEAVVITFEVSPYGEFTETVPKALYTLEYVSDLLTRTATQILAVGDL